VSGVAVAACVAASRAVRVVGCGHRTGQCGTGAHRTARTSLRSRAALKPGQRRRAPCVAAIVGGFANAP
jgi:hypothetical protein